MAFSVEFLGEMRFILSSDKCHINQCGNAEFVYLIYVLKLLLLLETHSPSEQVIFLLYSLWESYWRMLVLYVSVCVRACVCARTRFCARARLRM